jgi:preprotein translocase subunit SecF
MEFFSHQTNIRFMDIRNKAFILSIVTMLLSFFAIAHHGIKMGLEFTGGVQMEVAFASPKNLHDIRELLSSSASNVSIQSLGGSKNILLRVPATEQKDVHEIIGKKLTTTYTDAKIAQVEFIGPQVGKELLLNGLNAIIFALILTMVYIALRFEYRFGIAAIVALLHDPIITLGIFAFAGIEFDLISLAGVLTVLGYSLNDTIVVYDRIRENFVTYPKKSTEEIVNLAINETLSRTIITSMLTLMAVLSLLFFGGESLHGFSVALTIGIIVGTYSSIYVAGALAVVLGLTHQPVKSELHVLTGGA